MGAPRQQLLLAVATRKSAFFFSLTPQADERLYASKREENAKRKALGCLLT